VSVLPLAATEAGPESSADVLYLADVFGPTFQGEGPSTGRVAVFVRFGGCNLHCQWCVAPDTPVLMADWTEKPISAVRVGDLVWSYRKRRYELARVERTLTRDAERVAVRYGDRELVCTPDHVVATPHHLDGRRRSSAADLAGRHVRVSKLSGWLPDDTVRTEDWWTGWLQGVIVGDGHVGQSEASPYPKIWLRVCDRELAEAFSAEVNRRGARTTVREVRRRTQAGRVVYSVVCALSRVPEALGLPDDRDGTAGFLAGFFDAEGHAGRGQIVMSQGDDKTLDRVAGMCRSLGLPVTVSYCRSDQVGTVVVNGAENVDRFLRLTRPVLTRKSHAHRRPAAQLGAVAVAEVKEVAAGPVVNLTTSTGYFFAGGVLVEQCDTGYTWDASRWNLREQVRPVRWQRVVDYLTAAALRADRPLLVVTGGEPLGHQRRPAFRRLLAAAAGLGMDIEVETNGTRVPAPDLPGDPVYNVSPKLAHAGDPADLRIDPTALAAFRELADRGRARFKFVVQTVEQLDEVAGIVAAHRLPARTVWVMPEGTDATTMTDRGRALADPVLARGWNLTVRLHTLLWGEERGR
jgi:7-carboxy-7-deazaguanine synthase